jgi:hypothetical protein
LVENWGRVLTVKHAMVATFVLFTALGNAATAENKGTCPPLPPISFPKASYLNVSATGVNASIVAAISDTGYVCSARLLQKVDKGVATKVTAAIRQWHFDPAVKDGHAVPVVVTIQVNLKRDETGKVVVSSTDWSHKRQER